MGRMGVSPVCNWHLARVPPCRQTDRQTDVCQIITFRLTSYASCNNTTRPSYWTLVNARVMLFQITPRLLLNFDYCTCHVVSDNATVVLTIHTFKDPAFYDSLGNIDAEGVRDIERFFEQGYPNQFGIKVNTISYYHQREHHRLHFMILTVASWYSGYQKSF